MSVKFKHVGDVGVDSGQIMVGDPCYVREFVSDEFNNVESVDGAFPYSYSGACSATCSAGAGQLAVRPGVGSAVVSSTAFGDGIYPVFQVFEDGKLVALHIDLTMGDE
jgi:hypothetical protein